MKETNPNITRVKVRGRNVPMIGVDGLKPHFYAFHMVRRKKNNDIAFAVINGVIVNEEKHIPVRQCSRGFEPYVKIDTITNELNVYRVNSESQDRLEEMNPNDDITYLSFLDFLDNPSIHHHQEAMMIFLRKRISALVTHFSHYNHIDSLFQSAPKEEYIKFIRDVQEKLMEIDRAEYL